MFRVDSSGTRHAFAPRLNLLKSICSTFYAKQQRSHKLLANLRCIKQHVAVTQSEATCEDHTECFSWEAAHAGGRTSPQVAQCIQARGNVWRGRRKTWLRRYSSWQARMTGPVCHQDNGLFLRGEEAPQYPRRSPFASRTERSAQFMFRYQNACSILWVHQRCRMTPFSSLSSEFKTVSLLLTSIHGPNQYPNWAAVPNMAVQLDQGTSTSFAGGPEATDMESPGVLTKGTKISGPRLFVVESELRNGNKLRKRRRNSDRINSSSSECRRPAYSIAAQ